MHIVSPMFILYSSVSMEIMSFLDKVGLIFPQHVPVAEAGNYRVYTGLLKIPEDNQLVGS